MDEVLQRILLLIPKDQGGKYVRGSKKELADFLGLPHNIVAEWISGRNKSYLKYLYQIAAKYDVSVEWLRGETDEKKPIVFDDGPIGYSDLNAENQEFINQMIAKLLASQSQQ